MAVKSADQITIVDITDAYSVLLTSEAYTFVGGTGGVTSGATCTTQAVAFCGTNQCSKVTVDSTAITCPTGISASVSGSGTSAVTITFTTTATISTACEAVIPVSVDGITVSKRFSFAVAKTGSTGSAGSVWYSGTGITGTSTTATTFSGSGVSSARVNDMYLNTSTGNTYKCTTAGAASAAKWVYTGNIKGATGSNGKDSILMTITSSNGSVFKNSSGSTVLTAHVYVGGVEQTITDAGVCGSYGSVKWYKGENTTAVATAKTLTVTAADVENSVVYTAQLE